MKKLYTLFILLSLASCGGTAHPHCPKGLSYEGPYLQGQCILYKTADLYGRWQKDPDGCQECWEWQAFDPTRLELHAQIERHVLSGYTRGVDASSWFVKALNQLQKPKKYPQAYQASSDQVKQACAPHKVCDNPLPKIQGVGLKLASWKGLKKKLTSPQKLILFTAGPMAAGKSFALKQLAKNDILNLDQFVIIDPDRIKEVLPEYQLYQSLEQKFNIPLTQRLSATLVHEESGIIAENLFKKLITSKAQPSIIVDGSLRNKKYYLSFITWLKQNTDYEIGILYATAYRAITRDRALTRKRPTPDNLIQLSWCQVKASVDTLKTIADFTLTLNTSYCGKIKINSLYQNGQVYAINQDLSLNLSTAKPKVACVDEKTQKFHLPGRQAQAHQQKLAKLLYTCVP